LRKSDRIAEIAMTEIAASPQSPPMVARAADPNAPLREVARELEASFLAEMLKHAGFGESRESFGGGAGEDQFASLLRAEHARALTDRGGIGLAESLFRALAAREATQGSGAA
jgi:Rod binding domain-containing protein